MMDTITKKIIVTVNLIGYLLLANTLFAFTRQDTLRGSNGSGRSWWDVQRYDLSVAFDTTDKSIHGSNTVTASIIGLPTDSLQLDLQELMFLDSVVMDGAQLEYVKEGNVWWIKHPFHTMPTGGRLAFTAYYHGKPRIAKTPPWDGGFIWTKDANGNPWIAVACQGLGASVWWPCKDYQGDEPDGGMSVTLDVPKGLIAVSNGKISSTAESPINVRERSIFYWRVGNAINTYDVSFYIGDYASWMDTLMGEKGKLDITYCVLRQNLEKARKQFAVTKQMLHCFEYWMGPYPFYEDGFKLVDAPYLGMEHQSAIAYGNEYKMGYLGTDRSQTGVGLLFDYIIVHESGHEWFGNNITVADIADNWIHEGFTTYSETLFAECAFGKEKAFEYNIGERHGIENDKPMIGPYGVNEEGSGDIYDKGTAIVQMIRLIMDDDEKFRQLLRGLNKDFYHKITTSKEMEEYISKFSGYDFAPFFNQYLRTKDIPRFDWYIKKKRLSFRFTDAVEGFSLPLEIRAGKRRKAQIRPDSEWQTIKWKRGFGFRIKPGFLIKNS
jgi:aminopeptidase N